MVNVAVNFVPLDLIDETIVFGFVSIDIGSIDETLESELIELFALFLFLAFELDEVTPNFSDLLGQFLL